MFKKSRLFIIIFTVFLFFYWFVICPLLWIFVKSTLTEKSKLNRLPVFLFPFIFWVSVFIIFIGIVLILWYIVYCNRNKQSEWQTINKVHANPSSVKYHNERESQRQPVEFQQTNVAAHNVNASKILSPKENLVAPHVRLNSCDRCSKLITDEEIVNIFLNKKSIDGNDNLNENDDTKIGFEIVGKSVPQSKRFRIDENLHPQLESAINLPTTTPANISIPLNRRSTLKTELFIVVNEEGSLLHEVSGKDDVFD